MPSFPSLRTFEFHQRLAATFGVALVVFTAPACGACRRLRRWLSAAPDGPTLFEVDVERESALAHELGVSRLPALHLWRDGCYHAAIAAGNSPEALQRAIAEALRVPAQEAP